MVHSGSMLIWLNYKIFRFFISLTSEGYLWGGRLEGDLSETHFARGSEAFFQNVGVGIHKNLTVAGILADQNSAKYTVKEGIEVQPDARFFARRNLKLTAKWGTVRKDAFFGARLIFDVRASTGDFITGKDVIKMSSLDIRQKR